MSDFLSNFTNDNFDDQEKKKAKEPEKEVEEEQEVEPIEVPAPPPLIESEPTDEHVEFDPTYKKRRQKKIMLFSLGGLVLLLGIFIAYYQFTRVKVPDFLKQEIAQAREWSAEEGVPLKIENTYDFDIATNNVTKQDVKAGDKIKKGDTLTLTVSLGPDPEELLTLPNFEAMTLEAAQDWTKENKAENVSIVQQYHDTIGKGQFIKQEAADKELNLQEYKRKDRFSVYYSRGQETFEKNIEVPDFANKTLTEVTDWAKKNELKLVTEKVFSQSIAIDSVVSQSTAAGAKVAKQEEFKIQISKGKPLVVPDYQNYTLEQARELSNKVTAVLKSVYSETVPFGHFISQNIAAGTEFDEKDNPPTIEVTYSEGRPYIKDLRDSALEGDLPKLFFETYSAKGANITYDVYYMDSDKPKGTVIEMSRYGEYVPMDTHLTIGISLGNIQPVQEPVSQPVTDSPEPEMPAGNEEGTGSASD